jgi:hypothetical protein
MGPPDRGTGPGHRSGARSNVESPPTAPNEASVTASPMRRRREASKRLPSLSGRRRDPLDAFAGLPVRSSGRCCRAVLGADGRWRQCCGRGAA